MMETWAITFAEYQKHHTLCYPHAHKNFRIWEIFVDNLQHSLTSQHQKYPPWLCNLTVVLPFQWPTPHQSDNLWHHTHHVVLGSNSKQQLTSGFHEKSCPKPTIQTLRSVANGTLADALPILQVLSTTDQYVRIKHQVKSCGGWTGEGQSWVRDDFLETPQWSHGFHWVHDHPHELFLIFTDIAAHYWCQPSESQILSLIQLSLSSPLFKIVTPIKVDGLNKDYVWKHRNLGKAWVGLTEHALV